ncbi:amidase [Hyaloraphidium curvatum]|nr:amidase [Hyaloraphidium curvatum]
MAPPPPSDIDLATLTLADVRAGLLSRRFTAESLCEAHLQRIKKFDKAYNAFTLLNPSALDDARKIDARIAKGEDPGPLAGVPVAVKHAMDVAGFPTTGGYPAYAKPANGPPLVPERDAPVVARVRAAGGIVIGHTNIPAFSYDGARTTGSWAGTTYNAVDRRIVPGASSAGTATAVAGGFAVVGLAEETGGSIQNPAAAQSLVGIKPTFGLVPNAGVVPIAGSTRDVVGPHARTVRDAAILLDVLAGFTSEDPKTVASIGNIPTGGYTSKLSPDALKGAKLGTYGPGWRAEPLSGETTKLYQTALDELAKLGALLVKDPLAGTDFASLTKKINGFDRRGFESIVYDFEAYLRRLGSSCPVKNLAELAAYTGVDPFAEGQIFSNLAPDAEIGGVVKASLADRATPPDLSGFLAARNAFLRTLYAAMDAHDLDAFVFPQTSSRLPFVEGDARFPSTTVSEINIAGVPLVVVPAGRYPNGSPFALVFVGRMWDEAKLLALAYAYEAAGSRRIVPVLEEPGPKAKI